MVFSTYQSLEVLKKAQDLGVPDFDLVICDEAHRTTGSKNAADDSSFVRVHFNSFIRAKKRLYMTATPKIFSFRHKPQKEDLSNTVVLYSMDDPHLFGPIFHTMTFTEAIQEGILTDYKVLLVSVDERLINRRVKLLKNPENHLLTNMAAKMVGTYVALAKQTGPPMQRAVAFCKVIEYSKKSRSQVSSKLIAEMLADVVSDFLQNSPEPQFRKGLKLEVKHVDGSLNATEKTAILNWLCEDFGKTSRQYLEENSGEDFGENTCRIVSNVRCLSEGVDVPALDGVLFFSPRKSMVEVVQCVGRVLRKSPGKELGYVVLPIVIPAQMEPGDALESTQIFRVVWQVLQALRSHDDNFDRWINKLNFLNEFSNKIELITILHDSRQNPQDPATDKDLFEQPKQYNISHRDAFTVNIFNQKIIKKLINRVGTPDYLGQWASDIIQVANTFIDRIKAILEDRKNKKEIKVFKNFTKTIRKKLNNSVSSDDIIEMLAQHMITGPAFEAIFSDSSFMRQNPVSISLEKVLDAFHDHHLEKETESIHGFYDTVKNEVQKIQEKVTGIDNLQGKQKIIIELYDKFFSRAFPKQQEKLGIVYTPVEIVDFILQSVNVLLEKEFGKSLGSRNVEIFDPFTGTGTFITRLLQSGLIPKDDLLHKYKNEIYAHEILLLAYYIASINIETTYKEIVGDKYTPFPGIKLADTFQSYEEITPKTQKQSKKQKQSLHQNQNQNQNQNAQNPHLTKDTPLRVILGNPPYSIGQKSQNDNNKNNSYPQLDLRINATYAHKSKATLLKGMADSYIRAFRYASDQLMDRDGVIAFVTNSGYLQKSAMDGLRKTFQNDFQKIYIINLRGDIRKNIISGKKSEGENIFGNKSMTGIAITFLVKKSKTKDTFQKNLNSKDIDASQDTGASQDTKIYYHDIGENLNKETKLKIINSYGSILGIEKASKFSLIRPNTYGDWIQQRNTSFSSHIPMGDKKDLESLRIFSNYSLGINTSRDAWCHNFSFSLLVKNIQKTLNFYNFQRTSFHAQNSHLSKKKALLKVNNFISNDSSQISWSDKLKTDLINNNVLHFNQGSIVKSLYRPFTKTWLYFNRDLNERISRIPKIFPREGIYNLVLCVSGVGARSPFSAILTDEIPNLQVLEGSQCFPLFLYDPDDLTSSKTHAITAEALKCFRNFFPKETFHDLELFYYIYAILHSQEYREMFSDSLTKELPRIPRAKNASDFKAFIEAGQQLKNLHVDYDKVPPYPLEIVSTGELTNEDYYVKQMKFGRSQKEPFKDRSTILYNPKITLQGIPLRAYDYVLGGKSAIAWVMKGQGVKTDPKTGIVWDANLWATETLQNPKYPLELLCRVITVSLKTLEIVDNLPQLF
ncbi:MAG: DEAD/DEAH box helicase family protein [Deltaproteobacteria bacterium]|nr:DEAD/DEAH box helicase family protein [Deltaproteobacteria bacterium]